MYSNGHQINSNFPRNTSQHYLQTNKYTSYYKKWFTLRRIYGFTQLLSQQKVVIYCYSVLYTLCKQQEANTESERSEKSKQSVSISAAADKLANQICSIITRPHYTEHSQGKVRFSLFPFLLICSFAPTFRGLRKVNGLRLKFPLFVFRLFCKQIPC